jgi:hypothetical protein
MLVAARELVVERQEQLRPAPGRAARDVHGRGERDLRGHGAPQQGLQGAVDRGPVELHAQLAAVRGPTGEGDLAVGLVHRGPLPRRDHLHPAVPGLETAGKREVHVIARSELIELEPHVPAVGDVTHRDRSDPAEPMYRVGPALTENVELRRVESGSAFLLDVS